MKKFIQERQNIINRIGGIDTSSAYGLLERHKLRKELYSLLDRYDKKHRI